MTCEAEHVPSKIVNENKDEARPAFLANVARDETGQEQSCEHGPHSPGGLPPEANDPVAHLAAIVAAAHLNGGRTGARGTTEHHEERANVARALGDEAAREHELAVAHRLYAEMGATGHAERLAREIA